MKCLYGCEGPARPYPGGTYCSEHAPAAAATAGTGRYCPPARCYCGACPSWRATAYTQTAATSHKTRTEQRRVDSVVGSRATLPSGDTAKIVPLREGTVVLEVFALVAAWHPTSSRGLTAEEVTRALKRPTRTVTAAIATLTGNGYLESTPRHRHDSPVYAVTAAAAAVRGVYARRAAVQPEAGLVL